MRLWISDTEARELRGWAVQEGNQVLADRLHRLARVNGSRAPIDWRWRSGRPVLLRCEYCEQWYAYRKHRLARREFDEFEGAWVHKECLELWKEHRVEIMRRRYEESSRKKDLDFLLGAQELLARHRGVLIRVSQPEENSWLGLLDDMETEIQADFGNERVRTLIDEMPKEIRSHLVAAGFQGFHYHYHVLLGWVEQIPDEYDEKVIGDVMSHSVLVEELPKHLRQELRPDVRELL